MAHKKRSTLDIVTYMSKFKLETDLTKYLMLTKIYNMPINALLHERHFLLMLCDVIALED